MIWRRLYLCTITVSTDTNDPLFSVIDDSIGCIKSEYDRHNDDREGDGCGHWPMRESKISLAVFDDAEIRRQLGKQQK
jgi:hypothetical protein